MEIPQMKAEFLKALAFNTKDLPRRKRYFYQSLVVLMFIINAQIIYYTGVHWSHGKFAVFVVVYLLILLVFAYAVRGKGLDKYDKSDA